MSSALMINKDSLIDYKKTEVMHFNQLKDHHLSIL